MRLTQSILKRKFPSVDKPLRINAPPKISPSKRASEKYKPWGLFSEFYGMFYQLGKLRWWAVGRGTTCSSSLKPPQDKKRKTTTTTTTTRRRLKSQKGRNSLFRRGRKFNALDLESISASGVSQTYKGKLNVTALCLKEATFWNI